MHHTVMLMTDNKTLADILNGNASARDEELTDAMRETQDTLSEWLCGAWRPWREEGPTRWIYRELNEQADALAKMGRQGETTMHEEKVDWTQVQRPLKCWAASDASMSEDKAGWGAYATLWTGTEWIPWLRATAPCDSKNILDAELEGLFQIQSLIQEFAVDLLRGASAFLEGPGGREVRF